MLKKTVTPKMLATFLIIIIAYFVIRLSLFYYLEKIVIQQLAVLRDQQVQIEVHGLRLDPWQNRISADSVHLQFSEGKGTDTRLRAKTGAITLHGIGLFKALFQKEIWVRSVQLNHPVVHSQHRRGEEKQVVEQQKNMLSKFFFKYVHIKEARWHVKDRQDKSLQVTMLEDIELKNFSITNRIKGSLQWQVGKTNITSSVINFPKDYYQLSIKEIFYNSNAKTLQIDSLELHPLYNKNKFAQKAGEQVTRLTARVPYLRVEGCTLTSEPQFTLRAAALHTKLHLESYLDKRYPFKKMPDQVLPVEMLQNMPIQLQIDSLHVADSYAEHEEYPETGEETGTIFFTKLNATIANFTNQLNKPKNSQQTTLSATALFMGTGNLRAEFSFPKNAEGDYYASGMMYDFPFTKLNTVTEPLAKARVESGYLNWVKFNFKYNNNRSDGELEMNYKGLKVVALKKDDPTKKVGFKNFILNTFILKENINEKLPKEKRTGTIQCYRDRRRSVFYYWWKSVLSGVLSTYNIDKVPQRKE